jgi:hypothetical protein
MSLTEAFPHDALSNAADALNACEIMILDANSGLSDAYRQRHGRGRQSAV